MNRTSIICLAIAVASLSFALGQATQGSASAGATQARVQRVKDTEANQRLHLLFQELSLVLNYQNHARDVLRFICEAVVPAGNEGRCQ